MFLSVADYTFTEQLLVVGTTILLSVLLAEIFDWINVFSSIEHCLLSYGYNETDGPNSWKMKFAAAGGEHQSPINVCTESAPIVVASPLNWSAEYCYIPHDLRLCNDGHSVTLYPSWKNCARPNLTGGPFGEAIFELYSVRFRWGPTDNEGSEHSIDSVRFAMEMQATHIRQDLAEAKDLSEAGEKKAIAIISYFFEISNIDDANMEKVVSSLARVRCPFSRCKIIPFPLSNLLLPFGQDYFTYKGSLTYPPCTEGVLWIIQPKPIIISSRQVRKFRKLMSDEGPILNNCRPLQSLNNREIFCY